MGCVPYYHLIRHLDDVGNGGDTHSLAYEPLAVHLFFGGLQTDDLDFKEFSTKNFIRLDTKTLHVGLGGSYTVIKEL